MKGIPVISVLILAFAMVSCGTTNQLTSGSDRSLVKAWNKLGLSDESHTGLSIVDPTTNEVVFNYRADNYFTSASNTKILTLYAALQVLDDSIVSARYVETNDSLFVWGGGDPGTLYPNTDTTNRLVDFLIYTDKAIMFSEEHFKAERFGQGWAWDDYPYAFQCERSAFPVYGNRIWIHRNEDSISVKPEYLEAAITISKGTTPKVGKSEWGDDYYYTYDPRIKSESLVTPITFFENDTRYTWAGLTGKNINYSDASLPENSESLMGSPKDSLLKYMMHESDNFMAEQILLSCSLKELGYMSDSDFIKKFKDDYLFNLPNDVNWFDGSGLSRYNSMTPATIVDLLQRIYDLKGKEYVTEIFSAGGQSGTIEEFFKSPNGQPYVYAKSGSLRNIYCLSGYIITKSDKVLLFSWMNNNLQNSAKEIKAAMEDYLLFVYEQY